MKIRKYSPIILAATFALSAASFFQSCQPGDGENRKAAPLNPDPDNGGIELPDNFGALVVADNTGKARHLIVRENGDIYVAMENMDKGGGIAALRDTTGDGKADRIEYFGAYAGTGIDIEENYLYFAPDSTLFRYPLNEKELLPGESFETIASGLTAGGSHAAKTFTFDGKGNVYVNIGAPSNACQDPDRKPGVPGQAPCPILEYAGGIWQFSAGETGQSQEDGHHYATGIRNAVALDWNSSANTLYALQHGRDQLANLWPDLYTDEESAELPAEEFLLVNDGSDFGWPYCYYDQIQNKKVLAPEYGGDGQQIAGCDSAENPIMAFPGHWAPNDLLFYTGDMFPEKYRNGAFIAFHGSWNRAPLKQAGYIVAFVPFNGRQPSGDWEVFADGFTGVDSLISPGDAEFRPMGLAQGPDGSLYISDSQGGRIWRVIYKENEGE